MNLSKGYANILCTILIFASLKLFPNKEFSKCDAHRIDPEDQYFDIFNFWRKS